MRNPWGREEYTGPFSDKGSKWTDAWKKEAGWVDKDDGAFFMPLDDFIYAMDDVAVLMYQDWKTSVKDVVHEGKYKVYKFKSDVD